MNAECVSPLSSFPIWRSVCQQGSHYITGEWGCLNSPPDFHGNGAGRDEVVGSASTLLGKKDCQPLWRCAVPASDGGSRLFPASFGKEARELALDFPPGRRQTYRAKGSLRNGGGWFLECQVKPSGGSQGTRSRLRHHLRILLWDTNLSETSRWPGAQFRSPVPIASPHHTCPSRPVSSGALTLLSHRFPTGLSSPVTTCPKVHSWSFYCCLYHFPSCVSVELSNLSTLLSWEDRMCGILSSTGKKKNAK